uniref:Uncharacterized protein n=1 Tax=Zooxanthella nutricula TaxID=1333877 RepID=A0A7S2II82_9DINO
MSHLRKRCRHRQFNVLELAEVYVDARKLLVLGPMWLSYLQGTILGAYMQQHMGEFALLVPASLTFSVGIAYLFFRQQLKDRLKRVEKGRLKRDLGDMSDTVAKTKDYIQDWRDRVEVVVGERLKRGDGAASASTDRLVLELQNELVAVIDTMHEVETSLNAMSHPPSPTNVEEGDLGAMSPFPTRRERRSMTR